MAESLFLILSGTYVGPELVSEFGQLPPCFLPNGAQRLYQEQITFAEQFTSSIVLLLPSTYEIPVYDRQYLEKRGVSLLAASENNTISESLAVALSASGHQGRLYLLFGDTVVSLAEDSLPDSFASGSTHHLARWADFIEQGGEIEFREAVQAGGESREVVAGFFDFSDATLLRELLSESHDFIDVLNRYAKQRALRPRAASSWLDFGHLHTYYRSRRKELAARDFNQLSGDGFVLRKTGTPARKIFAEASWYQQLPRDLRPFTPHFIDVSCQPRVSYALEYLHLPVLSELFSFGRLPVPVWMDILESCRMFLTLCQSRKPQEHELTANFQDMFFDDMIVGKTFHRLEAFASQQGLSLTKPWTFNGRPVRSIASLAESMISLVEPTRASDLCLWHGDFHFANILYDFRSQRVRVIDPRGMLSNGSITMYGDARYDISKLTHSVVGLYDDIIADRCHLDYDGDYNIGLGFDSDPIRESFIAEYMQAKIGQYACADAQMIAMVALLFLSMLPLHANSERRQLMFLANAYRLADMAEQSR